MNHIVFAIRDSKAGFYGSPFTKASRGEAERDFTRFARDEKTTVAQFPTDFDLFELGEFDIKTGKVVPHDTPRHMLKAVDVVEPK